jgi:hypothetical protein
VNETELQAFSGEHLYYEWEMVFFTAPLCIQYREPKDVDEQVIKNALLESFAIHVRVLKAFLFDPRGRLDDVISDDYVANPEEWRRARGPVPEILRRASDRTGGEVAHLTTRRQSEPAAKHWPLQELLQALTPPVCQFIAMTPVARLDWRFPMLAADLGCVKKDEGGTE